MIRASIDSTLPQETISVADGYKRLKPLIEALGRIHPSMKSWVEIPQDDDELPVSFFDEKAFISRVQRNVDQAREEYGDIPHIESIRCNLTTAANEADWLKAGRVLLDYEPGYGRVVLQILRPVEALGEKEALRVVKACVAALGQLEHAAFISVDAHANLSDGRPGFEMYMGERQLFPHRRWLGWMGFVPHKVESRHLPEAAELIPVSDKGTVIVAVNECFDLHNPDHIKKAHEVESRMAFLGLLEVTDKTLL